MNLILLRHGEAIDNVKNLISDKEIYWSTLTDDGKESVEQSLLSLPKSIDKIYVSPLPRTIQTANLVFEKFPKTETIIDNRLHEITYGKYSHCPNNEELDNIRNLQINGDYFTRFGSYGENKYDIEKRLCEFLVDVYNNNMKENNIVIVTHGSITSYIKRILSIKSSHLKTGEIEILNDVDFKPLFNRVKYLNKVKNNLIKDRLSLIKNIDSKNIKDQLLKIAKKEFNNIEFSNDILEKYVLGFNTKNLNQLTNPIFDDDIILVCFYCDFENFADYWMQHYINIGIRNFVLIDNNSQDKSTNVLKKYAHKVNISFWKLDEKYDCNKMCGWKQRIFEYYGVNKTYLTIDSDELIIYENYQNVSFNQFIKNKNTPYIKGMLLDVYTDKKLYEGNLNDFKYIDKNTYKISNNVSFGQRIYGGPRSRLFGINPSLQKIPLIKYTGKEIFANDHFYYPFDINNKSEFCVYLLHYKFLPGDNIKYNVYAKDGRHWNSSREYKIYSQEENKNISFYNEEYSKLISDIDFKF